MFVCGVFDVVYNLIVGAHYEKNDSNLLRIVDMDGGQ